VIVIVTQLANVISVYFDSSSKFCGPGYHPETPILARDALNYLLHTISRKETPILARNEVEAHIGPSQYGPR
jgi:hypothetical protein